jgi:glycosyltransferase involved in cell wall biosynthesis
VSVVVPCYEQAQYLPEAVASVIAQTFSDWEIVIVDDGSPDDTAAVAAGLIAQHPDRRIRLLRQANQGPCVARNQGIAASAGRYILPLDADDLLAPEMLERTVAVLDADPSVAIAYTDQRHFGSVEREVRLPDWDADILRRRNLPGYASLYRHEVWEAVGGYNPNMREGYEDWDFWIGAAERGFVGKRIPEPLLAYRVKDDSRQIRATDRHRELVAMIHANHPDWFAHPWRRWRHWPGRLRRRLQHALRARREARTS